VVGWSDWFVLVDAHPPRPAATYGYIASQPACGGRYACQATCACAVIGHTQTRTNGLEPLEDEVGGATHFASQPIDEW
jgi:hypothetical protein